MARPVGVVARVESEVVPEGVTPAVRVCRERDFAIVFLEVHFTAVEVEHHAVAEVLECLREPEVRFYERHKEERFAVETDVVVHRDFVANAKEVPDPVLVTEIEPARNAVMCKVKIGRGRKLELLARGTVGGDVYLLRVAALERRRDKEVHHRAVLELRLFGIAEYGHGAPPLKMLRGVGGGCTCGSRGVGRCVLGLCGSGYREHGPDEHSGDEFCCSCHY